MRLATVFLLPGLVWAQAPPEMSLEQALRAALENRAENLAAGHHIEARQAAVRQATRAPNPTLSIQTENWRPWGAFTPFNDLDAFVLVSQRIETAGKRRYRTEAAESERIIAEAERGALRWRLEGQVASAWQRALRAQQEAALIRDSVAAVQNLVDYHETRWREGEGAEIEVIKVRVELEREKRRLAEAEVTEIRAKHDLIAEMGSDMSADFQLAAGDTAGMANISVSIVDALERRPDLRLARSQAARDEALTSVQKAVASPDITPYVGYKRTNGFNTLVGGVSIPLKIRDRNQDAVLQAIAQASRRRQLVRALEARIRSQFAAAIETRQRRRGVVESLRTGLLADATEAHDVALAAYREGGAELLFVIDALRTLNDARLLHLHADFDYQASRTDVLLAAGVSLIGTPRPDAMGGVK